MHSVYSVLKLGSPPIDTEACSLVRFEVSPERAETVSRHQVVRVVQFVASFELLIDKRVVNSSDCHVVKQMRLVFVLAGVGILIVQVLDVHFHSAIRLLKSVVEKKRVLRPQVPSLRKRGRVPPPVHVIEPSGRSDGSVFADPFRVEVHGLELQQFVACKSTSKHLLLNY
jgi:hypothetical protein